MASRAVVIGGGISGLASAWRLSGLGHAVTLIEAEDGLGGLATTFSWRHTHLEKFYHCILPGDAALLRFIEELDLSGDLVWRETGMGFMHGGRLRPLNTALDLLTFSPLPFADRVRMGLMGLRARSRPPDPHLDDVPVATWLEQEVGARALQTLWQPLLESKVGDRYRDLPAWWLASRLAREKNTKQEVKGCLRRGYRSLIGAFETGLRRRGVEIRTGTRVEAIERRGDAMAVRFPGGSEAFDFAVATLPLIQFQQLTRGLDLDPSVAALPLDYQGVVCGAFLLKKPLSRWYWMPIVASGATCQGIVEMSNLMPPERTQGLHLAYLVNYTHRSSEFFQRSDDDLLAAYRHDLETLFPGAGGTVVEQYLFRAPFVEPLWPLGYMRKRPPTTILPGHLYLACTAQVYPNVNSWSACCEVVESMMPGLSAETATARPAQAVAGTR